MPIYEYACGKCEHEFEVEQRISDDPIKSCPKCRSRRVRKLISKTSFVLKGDGWYSDLYSSSKKSDEKGESKDESKPEGASEKSESKKDSGASKDKKKSDTKGKKGKSKAA
jgi:putative FmdB family regulatory protein